MEDKDIKGVCALIEISNTEGFTVTPNEDTYRSRGIRINGINIGEYEDASLEYLKNYCLTKTRDIYDKKGRLIKDKYLCVGSPRVGFTVNGVFISTDRMMELSYQGILKAVEKALNTGLHQLLNDLLLFEPLFTRMGEAGLISKMIRTAERLISLRDPREK